MARPRVEVLATPDCPHAGRAQALVERVLAREGIAAEVRYVTVPTFDDAESAGFRGSPTIRVDGRDVDPPPADTPINTGCRLYPRANGETSQLPSEDRLRDALQSAAAAGGGPRVQELPARALRGVFLWASRQDALKRIVASTPLTRPFVERFVAGETLPEALIALERLRDQGFRTTVDVLGEAVESEEAATAAADHYLETLQGLAARDLDRNVSVKLTQMGLDIDEAFCRENVARIVRRAAELEAFVRIDMEDHTRTDATLAVARDLRRIHDDVGVVIQAYLRRSADDVDELIRSRTRVRLCKGAYDEPATVAFATKAEVDESFARLMERLLLEGTYPAIATHDEHLIEHALAFTAEHEIDSSQFEFQMLYGVRRDLQRRLVAAGYTVRVYVPYGLEWYPYNMRRLAERPANLLFVLRSVVREGRDQESPG